DRLRGVAVRVEEVVGRDAVGELVRAVLLAALLEPLPVLEERVERAAHALDRAAPREVERRLARGHASDRARHGLELLAGLVRGVRAVLERARVEPRVLERTQRALDDCLVDALALAARLEQDLQRRRGHE